MKEAIAAIAMILGLVLAASCFIHFGVHQPKWRRLFLGLAVIGVVLAYGYYIVNGPPTTEPTDVDNRPKPAPIVATLSEKLKLEFSAYDPPSWPVAFELANCSSIAYMPPVFAEEELRQRGYTDVQTLNFGSALGYVATLDDVAVIMFRGTNPPEIQDWYVNLNNKAYASEHGPVHAGFWGSYDALHSQVVEVLRQKQLQRVWITGHSLGGALAVVCSYRLSSEKITEISGVMTFGQPRVGSKEFCRHMESELPAKMVHFVNENDLVPRVPRSFDHFGSLVWYTAGVVRRSRPFGLMMTAGDESKSEDEYVELPALSEQELQATKQTLSEQPKMQYSPDGQPLMQGNSPYIADHNIELYIDRLR